MELSYLRIEDFRNLARLEVEPGPRFNVFCGANGQGKTNLLEAVYMLSAVKSFRPQRNPEMIRWGAQAAIIEGAVERAGEQRVARIEITPTGKAVHLNDSPVHNLSRFFGSLNAIVFSPDDLSILKGGPAERRQFLDRAIFNISAAYLADAVGYQKVLKQRNALLRNDRPDPGLMDIYDEQLAELGGAIARRRLEFMREFKPLFRQSFEAIFSGAHQESPQTWDGLPPATPEVELVYEARWRSGPPPAEGDADAQEALTDQLAMALSASRGEDIRRGFTTRGPHRDDLGLSLGGHSARTFASQGQQRAMVLSMKIAEVRLFQERRGFRPILLLDDVSSELDRTRNRFLFDFLGQHPGQVFITTTHRDHILLDEDVTTFKVQDGLVAPEP